MATQPTKNKPRRDSDKNSHYNGWRVAAIVAEGIFGLLNSNKIYPVFGLIISALAGLIIWRLPEIALSNALHEFFVLLGSNWGIMAGALVVSNLSWVVLYRQMRALYLQEINRLAGIRKDLMHGNIKPIGIHRSSMDDGNDTVILPAD